MGNKILKEITRSLKGIEGSLRKIERALSCNITNRVNENAEQEVEAE